MLGHIEGLVCTHDFLRSKYWKVYLGAQTVFRACSIHWGHGCIFFKVLFWKKMAFSLRAPPKQMSFLTISNENVFFETQGARLVAIVAPNKGLE